MNVYRAMTHAKELKEFGGRDMVVAACAQALRKHYDNGGCNPHKLLERERFLCGLVYSEFLTDGLTNGAYVEAEHVRAGCMRGMGLADTDEERYAFQQEVEACLK